MRLPSLQIRSAALSTLVALLSVFAPAAARADATITVDADPADWASVTTCFGETSGDASNGIDVIRLCITNDNASGNTGSMYTLYEAAANLPTNTETYFGFLYDSNKDGQITTADEVFALYFPAGGSSTPAALNVYRAVDFQFKRSYTSTSSCGGTSGANGWSGRRSGRFTEMAVSYGCLGLAFNDDDRIFQSGVYPNFDTSDLGYYDGTNGTMDPVGPSLPVAALTAVSRNGSNTLQWSNPPNHRGVLIVRSDGGNYNGTLPSRRAYNVGETLGNGKVVYFDSGNSSASSWTDTAVSNGNFYSYVVFNHHQGYTYSTPAPSSSGLKASPTSQSGSDPKWCYSVGFPALMQPVTELGVGIFHAGNSALIGANRTLTSDPSNDGAERWRPFEAGAPIQSRFPVVQVANGARYVFTADQSGYTYAVNASTGARVWGGTSGVRVGGTGGVVAQPAVQLNAYSNAAFKSAHAGRDLVFFVARDSTSPRVLALDSLTGQQVWAGGPGSRMSTASGGMFVDYTNNRLWVPSRKSGGKGTTLTIYDTLNGQIVDALDFGNSDYGVNFDFKSSQVYFTANVDRIVRGIDLSTRAQVWQVTLPATPNTWVFPTGNGFIASLSDGTVRRYTVNGTTVSQMWSAAVTGPSGVTIDYATQKIYAGSSNGRIYEIDAATGVVGKSVGIPSVAGAAGQPTIDSAAKRLHVGSFDGRVCAFSLPF